MGEIERMYFRKKGCVAMGIKKFIHNKVMYAKTGLDIDWVERDAKMKGHIENMKNESVIRDKNKIKFFETKESIISKLEHLREKIDLNFREDLERFCKSENNTKCNNCDVFFILKFAKQHPELKTVLNF